jgi:hypothetical protein
MSQLTSDACGTRSIVPAQVGVERALARVDAPFGGTRPGGCLGDQLQVARRELRRLHCAEEVVRLAPRPSGSGFTAAFDEVVQGLRVSHRTRNIGARAGMPLLVVRLLRSADSAARTISRLPDMNGIEPFVIVRGRR